LEAVARAIACAAGAKKGSHGDEDEGHEFHLNFAKLRASDTDESGDLELVNKLSGAQICPRRGDSRLGAQNQGDWMMSQMLVYITASSRDEASAIGRDVVNARLAACANVLGDITLFYWWNGTVQEESEVPLILKTQDHLVARLTQRVQELHSYDCPCIVAVPIVGGNPEFLEWIANETE